MAAAMIACPARSTDGEKRATGRCVAMTAFHADPRAQGLDLGEVVHHDHAGDHQALVRLELHDVEATIGNAVAGSHQEDRPIGVHDDSWMLWNMSKTETEKKDR